jgi:hypothetical protein
MNSKLTITLCFLFISIYLGHAQSWQWGRRGGSTDNTLSAGHQPDESVADMATDQHGNIYVLSIVMQTSLNVDGHPVTGYGDHDILITSFRCDGTYRWSKDMGSAPMDMGMALKTDTLGGVYITGSMVAYTGDDEYISTDTSWINATYQFNFLAKFDTAGNYKWIRFPEPDTTGLYSIARTGFADMDVDGAGNIYLLGALAPGAYANGAYVVTAQGYYILHYDRYGNFISGNPMQITTSTSVAALLKMKKDFKNGRYYITGGTAGGTLSFGTTLITHGLFVGCFSNSGTLLWKKEDAVLALGGSFARASVDAQGGIYLIGSIALGNNFNGYIPVNSYSSATLAMPFIVKLDSNGNNIWAKNAYTTGNCPGSAITLNGEEVDVSGYYGGRFKWPGSDSLFLTSAASTFIARFNKNSGTTLGIDSLASSAGSYIYSTAMTSDRYGNFYLGGNFPGTLYVHTDVLNNIGGDTDFFIAKYGTGNCTVPVTLETAGLVEAEELLRVYPNPATDELNITGVQQSKTYRVISITGITLQQGELVAGNNTLPMRNLVSGIYILEMTGSTGERNIVRVVKQ